MGYKIKILHTNTRFHWTPYDFFTTLMKETRDQKAYNLVRSLFTNFDHPRNLLDHHEICCFCCFTRGGVGANQQNLFEMLKEDSLSQMNSTKLAVFSPPLLQTRWWWLPSDQGTVHGHFQILPSKSNLTLTVQLWRSRTRVDETERHETDSAEK